MKVLKIVHILAVTLALAGYSLWVRQTSEEAASSGERRTVPAGIPLIRLAEARALWRKSSTLFVDVRPATDYDFGHIPGALHLPEEEIEQRLPALKKRLQQARAIVVYCKSKDCGASLWAAMRLRSAGLTQTRIFPEGWNEWYLRGLPTTVAAH